MSARKIVVRDPGLWDADCVECPFADQDNVCCLAYALSMGNVIYCDSDGNAVSCPLNDGPVTVTMAEKEAAEKSVEEMLEELDEFGWDYAESSDGTDAMFMYWDPTNGDMPDWCGENLTSCECIETIYELFLAHKAKAAAEEFYIQYPMLTNESDGFMHFWRRTDCGYGPEITEAKLFSLDEIAEKHSIIIGKKLAWPKDYIDERAVDGKVQASSCEIEIARAIAERM